MKGSKDESSKEVSVVIPAYNEEGNIPILMEKIGRAFEKLGVDGEVILVNDGSSDGTQGEAEGCSQKYEFLQVINHRINKGLSEALMTGFRNVKGEVVLFLCADLQSDPEEDIPKLLEAVREGYDIVCGWRQGRKEAKIVVSKVYHILCRLLFGVAVHDLNWIKAFKREFIEELTLRSDWHRYIVVMGAHKGYKIKEIKTNYYPRKFGESKFGKKRILRGFLDLLVIKFELSFTDKPMLLFGSFGLLLFGSGSLLGLVLVIHKIITGIGSRPLLFLTMVLLLMGTQFLALGFVAELIVSLRERIRREKGR